MTDHTTRLARLLAKGFDAGEVRALCVDTGSPVQYDAILQSDHEAKCIELLTALDARGDILTRFINAARVKKRGVFPNDNLPQIAYYVATTRKTDDRRSIFFVDHPQFEETTDPATASIIIVDIDFPPEDWSTYFCTHIVNDIVIFSSQGFSCMRPLEINREVIQALSDLTTADPTCCPTYYCCHGPADLSRTFKLKYSTEARHTLKISAELAAHRASALSHVNRERG